MVDIDFMHQIREAELSEIVKCMKPGSAILEVGGGSGHQAKVLADLGYQMASIDLATSMYVPYKVFPIIEFDGEHIPFPDGSFDIVFTSNVLEYIARPECLHQECRRVLKDGGVCVHVVPSASWRFWTWVTFYLSLPPKILGRLVRGPASPPAAEGEAAPGAAGPRPALLRLIYDRLTPFPNGVLGNAFTEVFVFRRKSWASYLERNRFRILSQGPAGVFYTGHRFLGRRLPVPARMGLAKVLGSSCHLFVVQ